MRNQLLLTLFLALCACSGGDTGRATTGSSPPDPQDVDQTTEDVVQTTEDVVQTTEDADAAEDPAPDPGIDPGVEPEDTSEPSGTCEPCGYGELSGKVCAPNEQVFVNGATVTIETVDCDGNPLTLTATSGLKGHYHFEEVPCGTHTVNVDKGSFHTDYGVTVSTGEHTDLTGALNKLCFQATSAEIAVLAGNWDKMETLLTQLGLEFDSYTELGEPPDVGVAWDLLADPAAMAEYQIIFVNCGAYHGWTPQEAPDSMAHIADYVSNGGSFYMSDYAWVYGEHAFPEAIEFMDSDNVLDMYTDKSPQLIQGGQTVTATIADGALGGYLGKTTMQVTFDSGPQIAPLAAGPDTIPHVSAKVFQFEPPIDATIPLVLSYRPTPTSGRVIYTNFHNDAQANQDMLKVMQYLVFEL